MTAMQRVLILDTETTGTTPSDRVIEVGVILWSVEHATRIAAYSSLVDGPSNPAAHLNQIPAAALADGADAGAVWERLAAWVGRADAIVAHQASFDRRYAPAGWDMGKPWICTMRDVEWPHSTSKKLIEIALAHGIGVTRAHRALTDCELIERTLERCHELGFDVADMLLRGAREKIFVRAIVSYEQREKAKASGFEWDKANSRWTRHVAIDDVDAFPFAVERIHDEVRL